MIFTEEKFRSMARQEDAYRLLCFKNALTDQPDSDPVVVDSDVGAKFKISRAECEQYAQWLKEETEPETNLLEHVDPIMHNWIMLNRSMVVVKLKEAVGKYRPEYHPGVTLIWPIAPPDLIPVHVVRAYIERYDI